MYMSKQPTSPPRLTSKPSQTFDSVICNVCPNTRAPVRQHDDGRSSRKVCSEFILIWSKVRPASSLGLSIVFLINKFLKDCSIIAAWPWEK